MRRFGWMLVWAGLVAGCQRADVDYAPETDFAAYRTYAWEPRRGERETVMERDYPHLMDEIRGALGRELEARGLVAAPPDGADLVAVAHLELNLYETNTRGELAPEGGDAPSPQLGPLVFGPYATAPAGVEIEADRQLQEGTLLLNLTARETGTLVWQSWLQRVVDVDELRQVEWSRTPDPGQVRYQTRLVNKAAAALLAEFPPPHVPTLPPLPAAAAAPPESP